MGTYYIHVLDRDKKTAGKPVKVDVFDPAQIKVAKLGDIILGQDNHVRVDTSKAGEGTLSVAIRAAGQEVEHAVHEFEDREDPESGGGRSFDVSFYPTMAIAHKLDIKYNGIPVTTSPIEAKVSWR